MDSVNILNIAIKALDEKKAKDLTAVEVANLTSLAEYFIFSTATSSTHVHALSDEVEQKLAEAGVEPHHIEGRTTGWIVLDYGSVIVHVFSRDQREFYGLDKMWSDAKKINIEDILNNTGDEKK